MPIKSKLKSTVPRREAYKRQITLLSHGYSNPTAWPDGKITVYPWDSEMDQWIIDNTRKMTQEELLYGMLCICCDMNGGKVEEFVAEEITVVLLVSRALTNDGTVVYEATCPACGKSTKESIKIPDQLEKVGEKAANYVGFDVRTLPVIGDVVKLRPLLVKDEQAIFQRPKESMGLVSNRDLRTLMRIVSINDTVADSLDELVTWWNALPPKDAKFIREEGIAITPHLNTQIPHICDDPACRTQFTKPLGIDAEFFR